MFRLKADVEIKADTIDHAKSEIVNLFTHFKQSKNAIVDFGKGQISLTPTEGPLAKD